MNFVIPSEERSVTDEQVFNQLDLEYNGLEGVKKYFLAGNIDRSKKELVNYFHNRQNVKFLFDYRGMPLKKIAPDESPYSWQSSLGYCGSLKDFCLYVGNKMMSNIYVLPGTSKLEHDLGRDFENMIHFNFLTDLGKGHRHKLDMFTRGQFFESLAVLYHEDGDTKVAEKFTQVLTRMFETYNLIIENPSPSATRMQYTEDRDIMSIGWLTIAFISLLYTELAYTVDYKLIFEMIKRIWFFSIQFRRFDNDSYRPHNHHMWERGLMPYILSVVLPEFKDLRVMKKKGRAVVNQHVYNDFNEHGGYSEHSIAYWSGAAVGEMLFRGMYIANQNNEALLDEKAFTIIDKGFDTLAGISSPNERYPSIGDNGGPSIDPILRLGTKMTNNKLCSTVLEARKQSGKANAAGTKDSILLDYCDEITGFGAGRSDWSSDANYFLMSVKKNCGDSGHNHMDMLSMCIMLRGERIIGEPYVNMLYHKIKMNSDERGFMYNMTSHNTVLAYSEPVCPNSMYANKWGVYRPDTHVTEYYSGKNAMFISGYHDGYTFCRHNRQVLFVREKGWIVRDSIIRGNRQEKPHIQRWYLENGVNIEMLGENTVLLKGKHAKLLCVWRKTPVFKINLWKKEELYPDIMLKKEDINYTIDILFGAGTEKASDNITVGIDLIMLDVTDTQTNSGLIDISELLEDIALKRLYDEDIINRVTNL